MDLFHQSGQELAVNYGTAIAPLPMFSRHGVHKYFLFMGCHGSCTLTTFQTRLAKPMPRHDRKSHSESKEATQDVRPHNPRLPSSLTWSSPFRGRCLQVTQTQVCEWLQERPSKEQIYYDLGTCSCSKTSRDATKFTAHESIYWRQHLNQR